jgi:hypothetical protein
VTKPVLAERTGFRVTRVHMTALLDLSEILEMARGGGERFGSDIIGRLHVRLDPSRPRYRESLAHEFKNLRRFAERIGFTIRFERAPGARVTEPFVATVEDPLEMAEEVNRLLMRLPRRDESEAAELARLHSKARHYRLAGRPSQPLETEITQRRDVRAAKWRAKAEAFLVALGEGSTYKQAMLKAGVGYSTLWRWAEAARAGHGPFVEAAEHDPELALPDEFKPGSQRLKRRSGDAKGIEQVVLDCLSDDPKSRSQIIEDTGVNLFQLRATLRRLASLGLIVQRGSGKSTRWQKP